jgi:glycosyltransferase involved in cell wall biosynthesis
MEDSSASYHQISIPSLLSVQCIGRVIQLAQFLKDRRIDVIQTYFVDAQFIGIVAGKLAGVKKIVCCRRDLGFWHSRALLLLLRQADRFVDHFQVNSQAVRHQVANDEMVDPRRIHVIYNGIDAHLFNGCMAQDDEKGETTGRKKNLCVGILANFNRRVKRVDLFIRAAAEVVKTLPDTRFVIAGDGHLKSGLQTLSRELGIARHVEFLGAVTDIAGTIRSWDVGVISSESEGFCNSILEYMASGIPVVATAVGGNTELVEEGVNGFLVPDRDYLSLADRLCTLLKNSRLRKEMGERGKRIIDQKYDWNRVIQNYESFYFDILGYDYEGCLDHMGEPEEKPGDQQGARNKAL